VTGTDSTLAPSDPNLGPGPRVLIVVGVALLAGIAVWFLTGCNRDENNSEVMAGAANGARIVSTDDLGGLPDEVGHNVFWAGEKDDTDLEFSDDESGNVHLRYLTDGAEAGTPQQTFLDIGTYPFQGAYETTKNLATQQKLTPVDVGEDGIGFFDPKNPYSVILAFPDEPDLQIEVYHPEKNAALDVVRSGDIVPVP
jgi:hypothetical protein